MLVPQKTRYALRALFELAKRYGQGPTKIAEIARVQAIPGRFLEVILPELKRGGFVSAKRGREGGYSLTRQPIRISIGEVMRFLHGSLRPVECSESRSKKACPLRESCVFLTMWRRAEQAVAEVYDGTTFQDLVNEETEVHARRAPSYNI